MYSLLLFCLLPVDQAVADLGHDEFRHREAASARLRRLGPLAVGHLESAATTSPDPEIRHRARHLLHSHHQRYAPWYALTMRPKGWHRMPWLDGLGHGTRDEWEPFLTRSQANIPPPPQEYDWPTYRMATVLYVHHRIARGDSLADVQKMLDDLAAAEMEYIRCHCPNHKPPDD